MSRLSEISKPLGRLPFLAWGVGLFAVKVGLDYAVSHAFGQEFSILYYVSPVDAPLLSPGGRETYWLALWGVALPFIALGVWLTMRRLMDARLPVWLLALFFVPFANIIFFVALATIPSRPADPAPTQSYREAPPKPLPKRKGGAAVVMGAAAGSAVAMGMMGISVGLLGEYGAALFLGAPTLSAFVATLVFARLHEPNVVLSLISAMSALWISFAIMLAFALEGLVCLIMASPLAAIGGVIGWGIAFLFITLARDIRPRSTGPAALCVLPLWLLAEIITPMPAVEDRAIESVIEIDAPPDVVWNRVIAFEDLPPPTELIFRMGVSSPTGATISGEGVGAVRRCRFTTGEFVEPITVWDEGRELSFDVAQHPDPMREMTPYGGPRPPHLDDYFATTRGQFLLDELPGDRTRLRGRTWYQLHVFPRAYWSLWAGDFIHTIHLRVMRQIARLAEEDHAAQR
jgi:hypothetical protein